MAGRAMKRLCVLVASAWLFAGAAFAQIGTGNSNHTSPTFNERVAMSRVDGWEYVHKFGYNLDIGTDYEAVWSGATPYTYLSSPATAYLCSDSTADAAAGTGAREVFLEYLTTDYVRVQETLTMNGTTGRQLTSPLLRFHRARVDAVGSGATAAGLITVETGSCAGTIYGRVEIGNNQSNHGLYTIPRGYEALLIEGELFTDSTKVATWEWRLRDNDEGHPFQQKLSGVERDGEFKFQPKGAYYIDETTDLDFRVKFGTSGSAWVHFDMLMREK